MGAQRLFSRVSSLFSSLETISRVTDREILLQCPQLSLLSPSLLVFLVVPIQCSHRFHSEHRLDGDLGDHHRLDDVNRRYASSKGLGLTLVEGFCVFLVSRSGQSDDVGKVLELFRQERFLQFDSYRFVRSLLHRSDSSIRQHVDRVGFLRGENRSRLRLGNLVYSLVGLSQHRTEDGTETRDDPTDGQEVSLRGQMTRSLRCLGHRSVLFYLHHRRGNDRLRSGVAGDV